MRVLGGRKARRLGAGGAASARAGSGMGGTRLRTTAKPYQFSRNKNTVNFCAVKL